MLITDLNLRTNGKVLRVEALIRWEDVDRDPFVFFLDTTDQFRASLWPDPNAFVMAAILPAWHAGEKRIQISDKLCPVFRDNLKAAMSALKSWYPGDFGPMPLIEASRGFEAKRPVNLGAVSLLSCGIDSLATLRINRLNLPLEHPDSIRAGVMVSFSRDEHQSRSLLLEEAAGRMDAADNLAAEIQIDLIPVRTNLRWLEPDGYFFSEKAHGAFFNAAACFFSNGFQKGYISSDNQSGALSPWGSHPLLDNYYSSSYFSIEHFGLHLSRSEKVSLVASWPAGLQAIRVCQNDNSGASNCGTCEKCIRTRLALLVLDKLECCTAFPANDVTPELIHSLETYEMIHWIQQHQWYRNFIPGLADRGRSDLVSALNLVLEASHKRISEQN